jgi:hypothetical protein
MIALGSFRIFQKYCGDICKLRCTTGINDTSGKFAIDVNGTGGKFSAGVNYTGGKIATGINKTGANLPPILLVSLIPAANLPPVSVTPVANNGTMRLLYIMYTVLYVLWPETVYTSNKIEIYCIPCNL